MTVRKVSLRVAMRRRKNGGREFSLLPGESAATRRLCVKQKGSLEFAGPQIFANPKEPPKFPRTISFPTITIKKRDCFAEPRGWAFTRKSPWPCRYFSTFAFPFYAERRYKLKSKPFSISPVFITVFWYSENVAVL